MVVVMMVMVMVMVAVVVMDVAGLAVRRVQEVGLDVLDARQVEGSPAQHLIQRPRGRYQGSKSKRTAPFSSFSRALNGFPAFDVKPLRSGLLPLRRRA